MSVPIKVVQDLGKMSSASAAVIVRDPIIVRTGILHAAASQTKVGGNIGVCNTTTDAGISSIHVLKGEDLFFRYGHPAQAVVTGITTGATTVLTLNHTDTKLRVGDRVTLLGSSVGIYNTSIAHKEIIAISSPQQWNDYAQTITVDVDTSTGHAAFTGIATAAKSVIPFVLPETSSGCDMFVTEVQLG
jgi:hypothetical protein